MAASLARLAAGFVAAACALLVLSKPAAADYWEASAPNQPPQQFSSGLAGALWAISATYGWSCNSGSFPACTLETCYPVMDSKGAISLYHCVGRATNGGVRPGSAKLICTIGGPKHGGCPEVKACNANGARSGNPIDIGAGGGTAVKREFASDFSTSGNFSLRFDRYYSSAPTLYAGPQVASRFGKGWQSNFDGYAFYIGTPSGTPSRLHFLANGQEYDFMLSSGVYKLAYYNTSTDTWAQPRKGAYAAAVKVGSTYELTTSNDTVYVYNFSGQLTSIRRRGGYTQTLAYNGSGQHTTVTDAFNRTLTFTYNNHGLRDTMTLPDNRVVKFRYKLTEDMAAAMAVYGLTYDGSQTHDNWVLEKVVYPDDTPATDTDNPTLLYHYENASYPWALTGITDERGVRYATFAYDASGSATTTSHAGGVDQHTVSYNAGTSTATVTNPLGKNTDYVFESDGQTYKRLKQTNGVASTNCPASQNVRSYDANNYPNEVTDEEGRIAKYVNDTRGRPTSVTEAFGTANARTTTATWHATFNLPTQIVAPRLTTALTYDASGRLTQRTETDTTSHTVPYSTNGQARTTTYTYTAAGLLDTVDGPLAGTSDRTDYDYNAAGFVTRVTNGLGHITDITSLDGAGRPLTVVDPNGVTTNIAYDPRGRITSLTVNPGASQAVTSFQYDGYGNVTQVTRPNNVVLSYTYNNARRLIRITNAANEKIEYTYDAMGNVTQTDVKNTSGTIVQQVRNTYDELGRTLKLIGAANQETRYAYDKLDNNTQVTDPRNKVYANTFDELNRFTRETDPNTNQTNLAYTTRDDVASVTDARTNATTYVRNGWGDIIRETSPDRGVTDYVYDARGLMTQRTDARGQVTNFAYDGLGRMTSRAHPGVPAETLTWTYDSVASGNKGVGRLTGLTDPSGTVAYTWNTLGHMTRVVRVIGARTYQTDYAYDKDGNVTEITMPSGRIVTYTRDSLARVTAVSTKDNAGALSNTVASSIAWRPFGPLASLTFGNSIALTLAYDNDGRVTDIDAAGGGTTVQDLTYGYDPASNITSIGDNLATNRSQTFVYDNLNRLTSATGLYGTNTYAYDAVGNRTQKTVTVPFASTDTYTTPATSNRLSSIAGGSNRTLSYEASGQASTDQRSPVDTWTYTTDKAGRMAEAKLNTVSQATFAYDADELRIRKTKTATGDVTHYLYDADGQLIAEMNGATGNAIREYIWLGGVPIGYVDRLGTSGASRLFFVHADHLARPQKITDSSRAIVWDGVFAPFGEVHAITGSIVNVLMFPGQVYDPETGLAQNWHRDYDANIGRYLQSDPIGLDGGFNTYAYAEGNPVSFTDPTGEFVPQLVGFAIGAGLEYLTNPCATAGDILLAGGIGAVGGGLSKAAFLRFGSRSLTRETGYEWSHSIARETVGRYTSGWFRRALNRRGGLNGSWVSPRRHYWHDGSRYPRGWEYFGKRFPEWLRPFDRIPDWLKGTAILSPIGAGVAGSECGCHGD